MHNCLDLVYTHAASYSQVCYAVYTDSYSYLCMQLVKSPYSYLLQLAIAMYAYYVCSYVYIASYMQPVVNYNFENFNVSCSSKLCSNQPYIANKNNTDMLAVGTSSYICSILNFNGRYSWYVAVVVPLIQLASSCSQFYLKH